MTIVYRIVGILSIVVGILYSHDVLIKLRFGELLRQRGITPNKLAMAGYGLSRNTVYGLANPSKERVRLDLDVLASAMVALEKATGQAVTINDVLEVIEEPLEEMDGETKAWLDGAAYAMADRLAEIEKDVPPEELKAWHASFKGKGTPVRYDQRTRKFVEQP